MTHQEAGDSLAAERYLLEEMSDDDRSAFEEHFFSCEACADDLRTAAAMLQGAKDGLMASQTSGQVIPMPTTRQARTTGAWYRSTTLPWAAAATLAAIVAYQSFWVVPSLRRDGSPFAIVPVTLHPESRGGEAIVARQPGGAPVTLAVEINEPPQAGELGYELKTADGRLVASGRAAAPAGGMPLLLLIPSWTLSGSMHYILSVRDTAGTGRPLGEYRFVVSMQ